MMSRMSRLGLCLALLSSFVLQRAAEAQPVAPATPTVERARGLLLRLTFEGPQLVDPRSCDATFQRLSVERLDKAPLALTLHLATTTATLRATRLGERLVETPLTAATFDELCERAVLTVVAALEKQIKARPGQPLTPRLSAAECTPRCEQEAGVAHCRTGRERCTQRAQRSADPTLALPICARLEQRCVASSGAQDAQLAACVEACTLGASSWSAPPAQDRR